MTHEQRARECAPEMVRRVAHELGASWSDMTVVAAERFVSDYLTALLAEVEREARADEREACHAAFVQAYVDSGPAAPEGAAVEAGLAAIRARGGDAP